MARYFFHLITTSFIVPDHTNGRDLEDNSAAHDCALTTIKAIMEGKPWRRLNPMSSSVEVTDERGKPLLNVPFQEALPPLPRARL